MTDTPKTPDEILATWAELRLGFEELEKDLHKSLVKGNASAGRRARAKLRAFKNDATKMVRAMLELERNTKDK